MSKIYEQLLKDPKWIAKSKQIKQRDKHTCTKCNITNVELHVHHKYYTIGKNPWEYPNNALTTLCYTCHKKEHTGKSIKEFIKPTKTKKGKTHKVKKKPTHNHIGIIPKPKKSQHELRLSIIQHKDYQRVIDVDKLDLMVQEEFHKRHPNHIKNIKAKLNKNPMLTFKVKEMKRIREELIRTL